MNRLLGSILTTSFVNYARPVATWTAEALQFTAVFILVILQRSDTKSNAYNILWALVFGFATLNILNLGTKHFQPGGNRLSFGEIIAVMVVVVSITLLGWEMLYLFKVFPLKLR
jgi:hypothetical protein